MTLFARILLLVFLAMLPISDAKNKTDVDDIFENLKEILSREADNQANTTQGKYDSSPHNSPLFPNENIIAQIINLMNCGYFRGAPNSHLQYSLDYKAKSLKLFQTCDRYFKTDLNHEPLQVRCKNKKWVFKMIDCEKITCPRLTAPAGGHLSTRDNTYNTTVYFWCSRGFTINGTDKLLCEENGHWNYQPPTCHLSSCRPLSSPRHGFVSSQEETPTNQTVEFTCKSDYTLLGDAVLRCEENGRWNTSAPVCKKMCIVPNCTNQLEGIRLIPGLKTLSIGSMVQQGQRVIFSCKAGYAVPSSGISTCIGGSWGPKLQCQKTCTAVAIPNGKYVLSKVSPIILYACNPGYKLIGQRTLTCLPNSTWDSEIPSCVKVCTLLKRQNVASYRNIETYEIIPFGAQVVNGTQLYEICGSNSSMTSEIDCLDGELSPSTCGATTRLINNRILQIYQDDNWRYICPTSYDVCSFFGYRRASFSRSCSDCYSFDLSIFTRTNRVYTNYRRVSNCITCYK